MPSSSATATATRSATPPLLKFLLLLLACAATAAIYYYTTLRVPPSTSSGGRGRQGGGTGAGTKRPYTPLDVVLEAAWVAHHNVSGTGGVAEEGWELRYVAVLARHGARYPTKRKLDLALQAAHQICSIPTTTDSPTAATSPTGLREWCASTIAALSTAEGAGLAPLGYLEHKLLGEHVAHAYLTTTESVTVSLRAHVSSKRRTRESCVAFRDGAAGAWSKAWDALACEVPGTESEGLLRPYEECPLLKAHRRAVVGAEEERGPDGVERGILARARARVAQGLGLTAAEAVDDDLVMGLFYACQTDLTLLAPHRGEGEGMMAAHMAWIAGTPHLGEGAEPAHSPVGPFSACVLLPPELMEAMEGREDRENFHTRGYGLPATREVMAPFVRHVTARMEAAAAEASSSSSSSRREVEVFFAHDTTLLPTVALLDLIRLDGEDPGRSGAARSVPYASRLVLEAWGRSSSSSSAGGGIDRIRLAYNGRVLATLEGGLAEWRARYAAALAVRHEEICALEAAGAASEQEL